MSGLREEDETDEEENREAAALARRVAQASSRSGHEAIPPPPQPRPGLVQAAAVLDWFRCMAGPTESDLECDSSSVVRRSHTAAPRCRT